MRRIRWPIVRRVVVLALIVLTIRVLWRIPWESTLASLRAADPWFLVLALVANISSPIAKGWAWHLLIGPGPHRRWSSAQSATLIGYAVNCVSVGGLGEAARLHAIVTRDRVAISRGLTSILAVRAIEAIALALVTLVASLILPLPPVVRSARTILLVLAAAVAIAVLIARARWLERWTTRPRWLRLRVPRRLEAATTMLRDMGHPSTFAATLALALFDWAAQWVCFHACLVAVHIPATAAMSFAAMLVSNVGGGVRATPGNVGVMQLSLVVALGPFGVESSQAVAAALALQAVQIPPVLLLAAIVAGWRGRVRSPADAEEIAPGPARSASV